MSPRHIFIGDIHGCHEEVIDLLRRVRLRSDDVVVAVGDLVRKGPSARDVVAMWMAGGHLSVLGNNDAKLIARARSPLRRIIAPSTDRRVMRDRKAMEWLAARPLVLDFAEIGVAAVHGGVLPNAEHFTADLVPREAALELRYVRLDDSGTWRQVPKGRERTGDRFWAEVWSGDRMVVYGHTPGREPRIERAAIGLDTGCVYGGKLTAAIFDGRGRWTLVQVPARRRYSR
jgi:hypothetical protein